MSTNMTYRRFGKTELQMPVLTCGGMRYQQSWQDLQDNGLDEKIQANLEACIHRAFQAGITHI
jgi:predicted aldo/keto reductase-like oxidoreductase